MSMELPVNNALPNAKTAHHPLEPALLVLILLEETSTTTAPALLDTSIMELLTAQPAHQLVLPALMDQLVPPAVLPFIEC